jgi:nucleoside-diphosphate-sugar epimerase
MFTGKRVVMTGATSQVGLPVARALTAAGNEVFALGRYGAKGSRDKVEAVGAVSVVADLAEGKFDQVPTDADAVVNFAVLKAGDFETDIRANVEGVGLLMAHCRDAGAFLHCSSTAVYQSAGHHQLVETDPLGDNHRALFPTYSICKIAAETAVRIGARQFGLPTTIARLCVPYGDNGGWPYFHLEMMLAGMAIPVSPEPANVYNLLHEDDYIAMIPRLLEIASVPATVVNWGGSEATSIEEWCGYIGELVGVEPKFERYDDSLSSVTIDPSKMHELVGRTQVAWRDGIRRLIRARRPDVELKG